VTVLVTGAAGFIGSAACYALLAQGREVIGIDNLNDYYDPALKKARLERLTDQSGFTFHLGDIAEPGALAAAAGGRPIRQVLHLAAQAGVRYSIDNPRAYMRSNCSGHLEVLEFCRFLDGLDHLVYASSSSVYGGNSKVPFHESDPVSRPISLYAATKIADELMSQSYAHLYGIPQTGLRFFTVYGPWGRPDMAVWTFTRTIHEGKPIRVFNQGDMWRDFTYVDDIVEGTVAVLNLPPEGGRNHRVYNIGANQPEHLGRMIDILEQLLGTTAIRQYEPIQPGDVERTYADISRLEAEIGYRPRVRLEDGLAKFVDWYKGYVAA
jgi:UDP-glucuronate 4-epimerase